MVVPILSRKGIAISTPDMRGRFPLAAAYPNMASGDTMGNKSEGTTGGSKTRETGTNSNASSLRVDLGALSWGHSLTKAEIPRHTHGMNHGHQNINIDTFVGKTSGENGWEINKNTADGGGSHTHALKQFNHHHWFGGDDTKDAAGESEMSEYWAGDVVETDNSENYYDWESGSKWTWQV